MARGHRDVDKASPIPLYVQLKELLLHEIMTHASDGSYMLPAENALCEQHAVSIKTVRRVMADLVQEGWIVRRRGKGTFIRSTVQEQIASKPTIAVIADMGYAFSRASFEGEVLAGIEAQVHASGHHILLHPIESTAAPAAQKEIKAVVRSLEERKVGSVILLGRTPRRTVALLREAGLPAVVVDKDYSDEVDSVFVDNFTGGCAIMEHLVALGHRRIAYVYQQANGPNPSYVDRLRAYQHVHAERGLPLAEDRIVVWNLYAGDRPCEVMLEDLLTCREPPTVVFACDDTFASEILRTCLVAGIAVPDDLSVVGYDGFSFTKWLVPPLTTVHIDKQAVGREAARLAMRGKPRKGRPRRIVLPGELVIRKSCGAPSARPRVASRSTG